MFEKLQELSDLGEVGNDEVASLLLATVWLAIVSACERKLPERNAKALQCICLCLFDFISAVRDIHPNKFGFTCFALYL